MAGGKNGVLVEDQMDIGEVLPEFTLVNISQESAPDFNSDGVTDNEDVYHKKIGYIEAKILNVLSRPGYITEDQLRPVYEEAVRIDVNLCDCPSFFDATNKLIEMHSRTGAGLSENSHAQFSSSVRQFSRWCRINSMPSLPATVDTYLSFVGANAEHISISTMTIYTWAIRKLHLITGLADPTSSQTVKNAVASLKQRKVLMSETEQDQAIPIMNDEYLAAMDMLLNEKIPLGLRDAVLLGLCWHTMLRQSEIVRIQLSHFHSLPNGEYSLEIPYTKTNKTGVSEFVTLPNYLIPLIEKHITATGNRAFGQNAFLFIPLTRSGKPRQARMNQETQAAPSVRAETSGRKPRGGIVMEKVARSDPLALLDKSTEEAPVEGLAEAMDAKLVARTLKKIGERLLQRHPVTEVSDYKGMYDYSGHSARVGRAIHLLLRGVRKEDIVKAGRWKTDAMFERYTKKYDANSGHLAEIRNGEDIAWQKNHA